MRTRAEQFCVDAMQDGMKKCEEWNVEINLQTRKRKKMPEELKADAALTAQEKTRRVMKSALDTIAAGLDTRFQQLEYLHKAFGFLLDTETLMTADAIDLMTCRGNVQILLQHSQTTSTVLVLWMK